MIENGGGPIWQRIPGSAEVVGLALDGCPCAYPMTVLGKVLIVNDMIEERPYLVHFDPFDDSVPVSIFDARLEGRRITLGSSGLTIQGKHVLYDRGTESLWADDGRALTAFSGKYKGKGLSLVARVGAVAWSDWLANHPQARLLVGSLDRQRRCRRNEAAKGSDDTGSETRRGRESRANSLPGRALGRVGPLTA